MDNTIKKTLSILNKKKKSADILQIGPGNNTFHYYPEHLMFELYKNCKQKNDINNCKKCPVRYHCIKGLVIQNGEVCYNNIQFDQIIITANVNLSEENMFYQVKKLLKNNGELLFFVKHNENKNKLQKSYYFKSGKILKLANSYSLSIDSIKNVGGHNKEIFCIICKAGDN